MKRVLLCLLAVWLGFYTGKAASSTKDQKYLLIALDGLRWDYLEKTNLPNFKKFYEDGVRVKKVTNVIRTNTAPNMFSMVTGLYAEDHGVVDNHIYDPVYNESAYFGRDTKWYNSTEPIWATAAREGWRTGAYMFYGDEAEYPGVKLDKMIPQTDYTNQSQVVQGVIKWLQEDSLDFVLLYLEDPDLTSHRYGPNSEEVKRTLERLDAYLGDIMLTLKGNGTHSNTNVIIASDHGFTDTGSDKAVNISGVLDWDNDVAWFRTDYTSILVKPGKLDKVYNALLEASKSEQYGHFTVYKHEDIPERFHYKNNRRIHDIIIMPDLGYTLFRTAEEFDAWKVYLGGHGFDNMEEDMKSTFLAHGPAFRRGFVQDSMEIVDLYPLMCHLMELKTCHKSPGNLDATMDMLQHNKCSSTSIYHNTPVTFVSVVSAMISYHCWLW